MARREVSRNCAHSAVWQSWSTATDETDQKDVNVSTKKKTANNLQDQCRKANNKLLETTIKEIAPEHATGFYIAIAVQLASQTSPARFAEIVKDAVEVASMEPE